MEAAPQDVLSQQARLPRLVDGAGQAMHRQRVFRAHVDDALRGPHHVRPDSHALQHAVRIAFKHAAIHERSGVAFVGVADDVLLIAHSLAQELPFQARQKAGAAASAQLGRFDLLVHQLRVGVDQDLI